MINIRKCMSFTILLIFILNVSVQAADITQRKFLLDIQTEWKYTNKPSKLSDEETKIKDTFSKLAKSVVGGRDVSGDTKVYMSEVEGKEKHYLAEITCSFLTVQNALKLKTHYAKVIFPAIIAALGSKVEKVKETATVYKMTIRDAAGMAGGIVALIVILVLCCCCCTIIAIIYWITQKGQGPAELNDIQVEGSSKNDKKKVEGQQVELTAPSRDKEPSRTPVKKKLLRDWTIEDMEAWCGNHEYSTILLETFEGMSGHEFLKTDEEDVIECFTELGIEEQEAIKIYKILKALDADQEAVNTTAEGSYPVPDQTFPKPEQSFPAPQQSFPAPEQTSTDQSFPAPKVEKESVPPPQYAAPQQGTKPLDQWSVEELKQWCSGHQEANLLLETFEGMSGNELVSTEEADIVECLVEVGIEESSAIAIYQEIKDLSSLGQTTTTVEIKTTTETNEGQMKEEEFPPPSVETKTTTETSEGQSESKPIDDWSVEELKQWCSEQEQGDLLVETFDGMSGNELANAEEDDLIECLVEVGMEESKAIAIFKKIKDLSAKTEEGCVI